MLLCAVCSKAGCWHSTVQFKIRGHRERQRLPWGKNTLACWSFLLNGDKHGQVAQWALVYSFVNVSGSETQTTASLQHCVSVFGEPGML